MLQVPEYALYEIHESGERRLGLDEKPLLVQLNWHRSASTSFTSSHLFSTVLNYSLLFSTVLYCSLLFYNIFYCSVQGRQGGKIPAEED